MIIRTILPIVALIAVVVAAVYLTYARHLSRKAKRRERHRINGYNNAIYAFGQDSDAARGWIAFALTTDPHTLIVTRLPDTVPYGIEFATDPARFSRPDALVAAAMENQSIHRLRFLFLSGTMTENVIRPGGALIHGEDGVRKAVQWAFDWDGRITARRANSAHIFKESTAKV